MRCLLLSLTLFVILMPTLVYSQAQSSEEYDDVILLKNGAVIRGKIFENVEGKKVKIERKDDGYIFEVPRNKIELITTVGDRQLEARKHQILIEREEKALQVRWKNYTHLGVLMGEKKDIFSISSMNGVLIEESYFVGAGIGWDNYPNAVGIPIFAEFLKYIPWGSTNPYLYVDAGYSLIDVTGYTLGAGAGIAVGVSEQGALIGQIGYRVQDTQFDVKLNYLSLMVGYNF